MIFNYNFKINTKKVLELTGLKSANILDFGCGTGIWSDEDINNNEKIHEITLYDKNEKLRNYLIEKYKKNSKIKLDFEYNSVVKNKKYNLVIFSSVIQYLPFEEIKSQINKLKHEKKELVIIIIDVPYLPRFIELIFTPFLSLKRFIFICKLIFSKNYKKINYFIHKRQSFLFFEKDFEINFIPNLHDLKILRYSVILKLK